VKKPFHPHKFHVVTIVLNINVTLSQWLVHETLLEHSLCCNLAPICVTQFSVCFESILYLYEHGSITIKELVVLEAPSFYFPTTAIWNN
jgi:hypothetical protein